MKIGFPLFLLFTGVMTLPAAAGVITLTNSTTGLFDASSGTRTVTVTSLTPGYGTGNILDVNATIDFAKADGEAFAGPYPGGTPFYEEIHFHLTGPGGIMVTLIAPDSWGSGSGQFDGVITFDDAAAAAVNSGPAPVAGTFRPTGSGTLANYNSLSALGAWTLFIQDTVGGDALRFRSVTLDIVTSTPTPEPASMLLLGLGLTGVAVFGRKKLGRR